MRVAALMFVVGCASQTEAITVDVLVRPTAIEWFISPGASCTCQNEQLFPASGSCSRTSDTPGCTCYPAACLNRVDLLQAGAVIGGVDVIAVPVPHTFGGFTGDFTQAGLSVRFEGCGDDAVAPLTNMFPDAVTPTVSTDRTSVSWPPVANNGFLVSVNGELAGETCRTEPDAAAQAIDLGYFTSLAVHTLGTPTTISAGSFAFHVWPAN